jgi:hypothetical protein
MIRQVLMVGADNKGLSHTKISKQVKIDEEKVKNNFHVGEIHEVTLHLVSNVLSICVSWHDHE